MAFNVEDGTGRPDANSYVSVDDANTYHAALGNKGWAGAAIDKETALRRATQYLDTRYRFRGSVFNAKQALSWPRNDCYLNDVLVAWPVKRVQDACCEVALRALTGTLYADLPDAQKASVTVGPVSVSYAPSRQMGQTMFPIVDDLLAPFMGGGSPMTSLRIERA